MNLRFPLPAFAGTSFTSPGRLRTRGNDKPFRNDKLEAGVTLRFRAR